MLLSLASLVNVEREDELISFKSYFELIRDLLE